MNTLNRHFKMSSSTPCCGNDSCKVMAKTTQKMADISIGKDWHKGVLDEQQEMCNYFGEIDWDRYKEDELDVLKKKIEVLLFGSADDQLQDVEGEQEKKEKAGRESRKNENKEREILVDELCDTIVKNGKRQLDSENKTDSSKKSVYMVFIFVFFKDSKGNIDCWPVFRVPNNDTGETASFIDTSKRVYSNWEKFLKNNQFPACEYCYPRDGKYYRLEDGSVAVDFGISPAGKTSAKFLTGLDITSSVVGAAATVVSLASLTALPIAAPIVAGTAWACGVVSGYSLIRSCNILYDRRIHKQKMGFGDREACGCYISILASAVGFGATAATSGTVRAVQNGRVLGRATVGAINAVNGGSLVINGLGIINSLRHLVEKHREKQLTTLDVVQFSASLLLFCHSTVNFKTARTIIENTQNDCMNDFRNGLRSNKHKKAYNKLVKNTLKDHGNTHGKALIIRNINKIDNADDFFAGLVRSEKQFRYVKSKAVFADDGGIKIDGKVNVDPRQFCNMSKNERVNFLRAAQKCAKNKISDAKFKSISETLLKDIPNSPEGQTFNNPFNNSNFMKSFPNLAELHSFAQQTKLSDMLKDFSEEFQKIILELSNYLFTKQSGKYIDIVHFVSEFVKYLLILVFEGHKKYILESLQGWIQSLPDEGMENTKFCLKLLEEFVLHPETLFRILECVRSFFCILLDSSPLFQKEGQTNYCELVSVANILLTTKKFQWYQICACAEKIFKYFGFQKFSSLIAITKQLCLYIEKAVTDMKQRYDENRKIVDYDIDSNMNSQTDNNLKSHFKKAIKSLDDEEIYKSLLDMIRVDAIKLQ